MRSIQHIFCPLHIFPRNSYSLTHDYCFMPNNSFPNSRPKNCALPISLSHYAPRPLGNHHFSTIIASCDLVNSHTHALKQSPHKHCLIIIIQWPCPMTIVSSAKLQASQNSTCGVHRATKHKRIDKCISSFPK